jgi:hypothetical protein
VTPDDAGFLGPIGPIVSRIERAKKHILDLEEAWNAFSQEGAYTILFKDDPQKKERSYYLAAVKNFPLDFPLIIGDAIHNLRSALDHLAHLLMSVGTASPGPFPHVYFPISEDASKYKADSRRKVQGMRQDAIEAIDAIEPYGGGAGEALYQLHCLNNIDKHRLLLTVWSYLQAHTLLPSQRAKVTERYIGSYPGGTPPDLRHVLIAPTVKHFPLKEGDVLLTIPHSEMEATMQLRLDIAFGEPKIIEGKSVFESVHNWMNLIRALVFRFDGMGLFK